MPLPPPPPRRLDFSHTHLEIVAIVAGSCGEGESVSCVILLHSNASIHTTYKLASLEVFYQSSIAVFLQLATVLQVQFSITFPQELEGFLEGRLSLSVT